MSLRTRSASPPPRRRQQAPVRRHVGLAEPVRGGMTGIAHRHRMAQQVVDHLAHEAQQHVGIGGGEHVVEMQILLALRQGLRPCSPGCGAQVAMLLSSTARCSLGQVRHRAGRQLGLEQATHGVDLRHLELVEEEVILQQLQARARAAPRRSWRRPPGRCRRVTSPCTSSDFRASRAVPLLTPNSACSSSSLGSLSPGPRRRSAIQRLISSTTRSPRLGGRILGARRLRRSHQSYLL